MKAGREHWVPLSKQALKLLQALPKIVGNDYLFPGERDKKPLSDMTLSAIIRNFNEAKDDQVQRWIDPKNGDTVVPHGFRSTFRDWSAEVGHYPREVAEHALAHSLPDKVEASYHRGTMLERRRPMMQAWANFIEPNQLPEHQSTRRSRPLESLRPYQTPQNPLNNCLQAPNSRPASLHMSSGRARPEAAKFSRSEHSSPKAACSPKQSENKRLFFNSVIHGLVLKV